MTTFRFINHLDEQQRFRDYSVEEGSGQVDSHGYSYLYTRHMYQQLGDIMGLDRLVQQMEHNEQMYYGEPPYPVHIEYWILHGRFVGLPFPENDR
jgi:hypothetical protein